MSINTRRKKFAEDRLPLSDADFLLRLNVPSELHSYILAARQTLAEICSVPVSAIYPEDSPESLASLAGDWDDVKVVLELEDILKVPIEVELPPFLGWRFFWLGKPGPSRVGEWTIAIAQRLHNELGDSHAC